MAANQASVKLTPVADPKLPAGVKLTQVRVGKKHDLNVDLGHLDLSKSIDLTPMMVAPKKRSITLTPVRDGNADARARAAAHHAAEEARAARVASLMGAAPSSPSSSALFIASHEATRATKCIKLVEAQIANAAHKSGSKQKVSVAALQRRLAVCRQRLCAANAVVRAGSGRAPSAADIQCAKGVRARAVGTCDAAAKELAQSRGSLAAMTSHKVPWKFRPPTHPEHSAPRATISPFFHSFLTMLSFRLDCTSIL